MLKVYVERRRIILEDWHIYSAWVEDKSLILNSKFGSITYRANHGRMGQLGTYSILPKVINDKSLPLDLRLIAIETWRGNINRLAQSIIRMGYPELSSMQTTNRGPEIHTHGKDEIEAQERIVELPEDYLNILHYR